MDGEPAGIVTCQACGATTDAPPPLGWAGSVEDGRLLYHCGDCARANLRSIEARLDRAWW